MKIMKAILAIVVVFGTVACASAPSDNSAAEDGLHTMVEWKYDAGIVEEAMEAKGIRFLLQPTEQEWVLAGVEPRTYAVGSARDQQDPEEEASVYFFDSDRHREQGLADLRKQTEKYNIVFPRIYEKRNVLILYWAHGDMNKPAKLGEKFTNAMNSLRVVTRFEGVSSDEKEIPFSISIGVGRYGGTAFEKGAAIDSIETHDNGRVHSIQIRGWRLPSAVTVEYRGRNVRVRYTESKSSRIENVLIRFRDDELDPNRIQVYRNGRKIRLAGVGIGME